MTSNSFRSSKNNSDLRKLDLPKFTIQGNRNDWSNYDWSKGEGDQWVAQQGLDSLEWKKSIVTSFMKNYIKKNSTILEIGPGAGRWTKFLVILANKLILADVSSVCLDICKKKFEKYSNLEYHYVNKRLDFIDPLSIDFIWSYDTFVHINPTDVENYIEDFYKILKLGGIAVIHHAGHSSLYKSPNDKRRAWRTNMDEILMEKMISNNGMKIIEQDKIHSHKTGDVISVFIKE